MGHKDDDQHDSAGVTAGPGSRADAYAGNELLRIASTMPGTDIDVVRRRVGEMNNFRKLAVDALDVLERHHRATLGANSRSQESFHRACQDTRDIFRDVLTRDLAWEQQRYVFAQLMSLVHIEGAKDTENKKLLSSLSDKLSTKEVWIAGVALTLAAATVAIVGRQAALHVGEVLRKGPS